MTTKILNFIKNNCLKVYFKLFFLMRSIFLIKKSSNFQIFHKTFYINFNKSMNKISRTCKNQKVRNVAGKRQNRILIWKAVTALRRMLTSLPYILPQRVQFSFHLCFHFVHRFVKGLIKKLSNSFMSLSL